MHDEEEGGGVWPAYVDALTNVILNLLFVVALLAATIVAMHLSAPRKPSPQAPPAKVQDPLRGQTVVSGTGPSTPSAGASSAGKAVVGDALPVPKDIVVVFDGDDSKIESQAHEKLINHVRDLVKAGKIHWHMRMSTDLSDSDNKRAGYLRIIAVRNLLVEAGVQRSDITLDFIDDGSGTGTTPVQRVELSAKDSAFQWPVSQKLEDTP
jgi:hypothetical protein